MSIDPVLTACHLATALQSIVSRNVNPRDPAVVSVTKVEGGDAYNVIPQTAKLSGTARFFAREVGEQIEAAMRRLAEGVAAGFGATAEVDWRLIFAPTVNAAEPAEAVRRAACALVGADRLATDKPPVMGSEDFAFMLEKVPGAYFNIGNGPGFSPHHPGTPSTTRRSRTAPACSRRSSNRNCRVEPAQPRRAHASATTHRISYKIEAPWNAVRPPTSNGGLTSTRSAPTRSSPIRPRTMRCASIMRESARFGRAGAGSPGRVQAVDVEAEIGRAVADHPPRLLDRPAPAAIMQLVHRHHAHAGLLAVGPHPARRPCWSRAARSG